MTLEAFLGMLTFAYVVGIAVGIYIGSLFP
jgi:hypothetical protein